MKKSHYPNVLFLLFTISLFGFVSCAPTALVGNGITPTMVKDMALLPSDSQIGLIEQGNNVVIDKKLTQLARRNFVSLTKTPAVQKWLHLSADTLQIDSASHKRMYKQQINLINAILRSHNINGLPIPPLIDSILETNHKRFGLIYFQSGFTRSADNRAAKVAESIGIGLLSLGTVVPISNSAASTMYCVIVDAETNSVLYYDTSSQLDNQPFDPKVLKNHLRRIFTGFFNEPDNNY